VAVDWDTTRVLAGRIGDFVAVARKTRGKDEWFVGAITDELARTLDVSLDFLPRGRSYVAEIYADGTGANWRTNPLPVAISHRTVTSASKLSIAMAPGGGQAIRIRATPQFASIMTPHRLEGRVRLRQRPDRGSMRLTVMYVPIVPHRTLHGLFAQPPDHQLAGRIVIVAAGNRVIETVNVGTLLAAGGGTINIVNVPAGRALASTAGVPYQLSVRAWNSGSPAASLVRVATTSSTVLGDAARASAAIDLP
jgi:hypothetical protein